MTGHDDAAAFLAATGRSHGRIGLCRQIPGGRFEGRTVDAAELAAGRLNAITADQPANVWASAGLLPGGSVTGRGTAADVVSLPSLFADLDVEPGKVPSIEVAEAIIAELSGLLAAPTCTVVASGHGLQPWWRLEDEDGATFWGEDDNAARQRMTNVLKGFGRLVAQVAARHDACVDNVYELARVMRLPFPNGANLKVPAAPRPVKLLHVDPTAARVSLSELEALLEVHVPPAPAVARPLAPVAGQRALDPQAPSQAALEAPRLAAYLAAIDRDDAAALADLATWPEGQRDSHGRGWEKALSDLARRRGAIERSGWSGRDEAEALRAICPEPMLEIAELKIREQWHRADPAPDPTLRDRGHPSDVFSPGFVAQPTTVATASEHDQVEELETLEKAVSGEGSGALSDAKLSKRFAADVLRGRAVYLGRRHGWRRWNSRCWEPVEESAIVGLAREYFIRWHASAAARGASLEVLKALSSRLSAAKLEAVVRLSKADVAADIADFDDHPDLLNVANGVVDLTTGVLLPHGPALLLTKIAPTRYVPGATHPDWTAALDALPDDCREWFQHRCGQGITGHAATDDGACITVGGGSDGKTVIYGSILAAIGQHGAQLSDRILTGRPGDHPTELAEAEGVRFALIEELPTGPLNVKRIKDLVGTPTIKARRMYEDSRGFSSSLTLFITTNHLPQVAETDHGTWRRLLHLAMPYRYVLPPADLSRRDRRADEDLKARMLRGDSGQHEAVLAWLVAGAWHFYAAGHRMTPAPASIIAASAAWRRSEDRVYGFLDADCELTAERYVHADELWQAYRDYATAQGRHPGSAQEFVKRLEEHELIVKSGVRKRKKLAADQRLSTRRLGPPTGSFQAWFGVAFKTDQQASDLQDSAYSGLRKPFLETSYAGEVSQALESLESALSSGGSGPLCESCEVPLSWQREAAGLAWCVGCSTSPGEATEAAQADPLGSWSR